MRLTLRTMLAYLDDILEPQDAEELSKKIDESQFASELVHRIRNSTRRLRLGAPDLEGRGMGLDANTVAEYLDNTLLPDHVPDFEKVCLESDVHLAEVASCHQILAIVLGEPARIDQATRDRVYRIGQPHKESESISPEVGEHPELPTHPQDGLDAEPDSLAEPGSLSEPVPVSELSPLSEPDSLSDPGALSEPSALSEPDSELSEDLIPDYMVGGRRISGRALAIGLVCVFALVAVVLRAKHPFNQEHPVYRTLFGGETPPVAVVPEGTSSARESSLVEGSMNQSEVGGELAPDGTEKLVGNGETTESMVPPSGKVASGEGATEKTPLTGVDTPPPPGSGSQPKATSEAPPESDPSATADERLLSPAEILMPKEVEPEVAELANVGRFVSEDQVLGRFDRRDGVWVPLRLNAPLVAGDQLVVLPTFRPRVHLGKIQVTFSGPTRVELPIDTEPSFPELAFGYGRAILVSEDDSGSQVRLRLAGRDGIASLPDAESTLALEVQHYLEPGTNPLTTPSVTVVGLFAAGGRVLWSEGDGDPVAIEKGHVLALVGDNPPEQQGMDLPKWYDRRDLTQLDRDASADLLEHITTGRPIRPISLSLMERTDFRRIEVAVLAVRCLSYLDEFGPILDELNGETQYSYWRGHYDALRHALTRSEESASKVLQTLEMKHAAQAKDLFRMLWGYSPKQIEGGEANRLVGFLEDRAMIGRVLALENLRRITGRTQQFRPEELPGQEKTKVLRWHRDLEDGLIRYKTPPAMRPGITNSERE